MATLSNIFRKEYAIDEELEQYLDANRIGRPERVFKNQDTREIGPGFSKEFYNELHRFYSQGNRRSGRTYLLARVLVNTAIETNSVIQLVVDHHHIFDKSKRTNEFLAKEIEKVLYEYSDKGLSLNYKLTSDTLKVSLDGNIYESTIIYNRIKNDYIPYNSRINEYPLTPDEAFGTNRKLLLLL